MTSSKIQDGRPHVRVRVVIGIEGERTLYMWTKNVSKTCGTDAQNGEYACAVPKLVEKRFLGHF